MRYEYQLSIALKSKDFRGLKVQKIHYVANRIGGRVILPGTCGLVEVNCQNGEEVRTALKKVRRLARGKPSFDVGRIELYRYVVYPTSTQFLQVIKRDTRSIVDVTALWWM